MPDQPPPLPPQLPPTLNYQSGSASGAPRRHWARNFFIALTLGTAISAVIWFAGWSPFVEHGNGWAFAVVPGLKIAAAIPLFFYPRWRPVAAGLLVSIPLGALMFFGSCMANFKWH